MIGMLSWADAEAFFACRSRHVESNKAPPITGPKRPAAQLSSDGKLMGGVIMSGGVYQITNRLNGNRYVGSTVDLQRRQGQHLRTLRRGRHRNEHLQRAFNRYGEAAFSFSVLEYVEKAARLIPCEQHYLDTLKPEYNISPTATSTLGVRHTEETCRKNSERQRGERGNNYGKHLSAETRRKISEGLTGRQLSDAHRKHLSEAMSGERNANYGRPLSEETKRKLSEAQRGVRGNNYGKRASAELRAKLSWAQTGERNGFYGKRHSAETRRKIGAAHKGKYVSEQTRHKMSIGQKARWRRVRAAKQKGNT